MKVLIVNAHPNTKTGQQRFHEFFATVSRAFKDLERFGTGAAELTIRDLGSLDEFLFEPRTMFTDVSAKLVFRLHRSF